MHVYLTARDCLDGLSRQSRLISTDDKQFADQVWVCPEKKFQQIVGFGGAFTEAAASLCRS